MLDTVLAAASGGSLRSLDIFIDTYVFENSHIAFFDLYILFLQLIF
jgi:hypothetical protein